MTNWQRIGFTTLIACALLSGATLATAADSCRATYESGVLTIPCLEYNDNRGDTTSGSYERIVPWKRMRTGYDESYTDGSTDCIATYDEGVLTIPCLDFVYQDSSASYGTFYGDMPGAMMKKGYTSEYVPDTANGQSIFSSICAACHGSSPIPSNDWSVEKITSQIANQPQMRFLDYLTDEEIADVAAWIDSVI